MKVISAFKRALSVFFAVLMTFGTLSVAIYAATEYTEGNYTYTVIGSGAIITAYPETAKGKVAIPNNLGGYTVTGIGDYSFYACTLLTEIIIPDTVTTIGKYAFAYCTTLSSVTIPSSVVSIGEKAFNNSKSVVIDCEEGSFAENYAQKNGIIIRSGLKDIIDKEVTFDIDKYIGKVIINFKNSWFEKSSDEYNHELARFCSDYAMLGYGIMA